MTDNSAQLILAELAEGHQVVELFGTHPSGPVYRVKAGESSSLIRLLSQKPLDPAATYETYESFAKKFAAVNHPKLQPINRAGFAMSTGNPYIVSPDVDGETLANVLKTNERLTPSSAIEVALGIAGSLKYAHELDIVHGNVSPSNIILRRYKERFQLIKILGFEIEPFISGDNDINPASSRDVPYMSPEQCGSGPETPVTIDRRSDIYSLGCIMYHMLTGRPPHVAVQNSVVVLQHTREAPALFHDAWSEGRFPVGLQEIVFRCLEKNPQDRYQNLTDLENDLLSVRAAVKVLPVWLTRHVATIAVVTVLFASVITSGIAVAMNTFVETIDEKVSFSIKNAITGRTIYRSRTAKTFRDVVKEAVANHVNLEAADLRGANLSGMDLRGAKLSRAVMPRLMIETNLAGADLSSAQFDKCKAMSANFLGAKLDFAKLNQCDFSNADLSYASVEGMIIFDSYRTLHTKTNGANLTAAQQYSFQVKEWTNVNKRFK